MTENQQEETKLTREQVLVYRERLKVSIISAERRQARLDSLGKRFSFMRKPVEKMKQHFRRVASVQKEIADMRQLLDQIDLELSK